MVGQHFKYVNVDPHMRSRDLKQALDMLKDAGIIHRVFANNGAGLPLFNGRNEKQFKLLFLDIGLVGRASQLDIQTLLHEELILINQGMLAEQFVGQELLFYSDVYEDRNLYYWQRDKRGSSAEVDYLSVIRSSIYPIEVKAGSTGRLRSMQLFLEEKNGKLGIQISQSPLKLDNKVLSIPLYMVSELKRLVESI